MSVAVVRGGCYPSPPFGVSKHQPLAYFKHKISCCFTYDIYNIVIE